jgi:hypothetical protein
MDVCRGPGDTLVKIKHTPGPWWSGFDPGPEGCEGCYTVGAGGGGTKRVHKVLLWTTGATRSDHANSIVASFAGEMFEKIVSKDWKGLVEIQKEIEQQIEYAGRFWEPKPRQKNELLEEMKRILK